MSSEFQALQCSCGCELNAENRLECLYKALLLIFPNDLILGLVNCETGINSQLKLVTKELPDRVSKRVEGIRGTIGFDFAVEVHADCWTFDVNQKGGISYEPIQRMAEHTDVRYRSR